MTMLSPFFVGKGSINLYNLANDSIRNHLSGTYVLVHNYTPSTGESACFPPSTLRTMEIFHFEQNGASLTAKGSHLRLGFSGRYFHDINLYPTAAISAAEGEGQIAIVKPEDVHWEAPRQIGGSREHPLMAGGVQRVDTEAAVIFMDRERDVPQLSEEWLFAHNAGLNDGYGLKSLEDLVGGRGEKGVRMRGNTITFGFVANKARELYADLGEWEGRKEYRLEEGFEFAQLELAHASMPSADDDTKGGREVLVFIKLPSDKRQNVSSLYIQQQTLEHHGKDILREIKQKRGEGLVVSERYGFIRQRQHDWQRWGDKNKTRWSTYIIEAIVDGARGFNAQTFEEVRASLQIEDSVEVMEYVLRRMRKEAHALKLMKEEEHQDRYKALRDAINYIADRHCGTVGYLDMANDWVDHKLHTADIMGEQIEKPKWTLPKKKKEKKAVVERELVDLLTPPLPTSPTRFMKLYGNFGLTVKGKTPRRLQQRSAEKRKKQAEEKEDLSLFSNAIGQPLLEGLLNKIGGAASLDAFLALRHNSADGDGQKFGSAAGAAARHTFEQMRMLEKVYSQHEKRLKNAEAELGEKKRVEEELKLVLREAAAEIDRVAGGDGAMDLDDYEDIQEDGGVQPVASTGSHERGPSTDTLMSTSSHGPLSSYHSADGRLPDAATHNKELPIAIIEDTPRPSKTEKLDDDDDRDVSKVLGAGLGLTPVKQSNQGLLAKLRMAKKGMMGKGLGFGKGFEKEDEKREVVVSVEEVSASESEGGKDEIEAEKKVDVDEVGGVKRLTLESA